jgi:hypothetical protein
MIHRRSPHRPILPARCGSSELCKLNSDLPENRNEVILLLSDCNLFDAFFGKTAPAQTQLAPYPLTQSAQHSLSANMNCLRTSKSCLFVIFLGICACFFKSTANSVTLEPPPIHLRVPTSECSGVVQGWAWNSCALRGSVVWTVAFFG